MCLVLFFLDLDITFAQTSTAEKGVITINSIYKILAGIMGVMTGFVTLFLQPTWVNGSYLDLDIYMKHIWILVSNIVYAIFAFLLIFIAFANIIGKGGEKFGLKQALPKFIVGVLIVPASWFIVQFMISLAGVLTVEALTLPYERFKNNANFPVFSLDQKENENTPLSEAEICTKFVIHLGNTPEATVYTDENGNTVTSRTAEQNKKDPIYCKPGGKIGILDLMGGETNEESIYSIISLYTFGLLGFESIDNVDQTTINEGYITDLTSLVGKLSFGLIFILIYFVLLIALFFALFVRILRIWIYTMLSPLFGLMYFFGKGGEGALANFNFKEFFALIMVPVYVSLALSFGFMFMMVASSGLQKQAGNPSDDQKVVPLKIGIIELEITGTIIESGEGEDNELSNTLMAKLFSFRGIGGALGEMIVMLFGIGFLWIAVMAALKSSTITAAAVQPIADFGNQVGKLAASAPMYAPIIPTGKGFTSAAGIGEVSRKSFAAANNYKVEQGKKLGDQFGLFQSGGAAEITSASQTAKNNTRGLAANTEEYAKNIHDAVFSGQSTDDLANNAKHLELINETLKDMKIDLEVNLGDKVKLSEAYREIDAYQEINGIKENQLFKSITSKGKGTGQLEYRDIDNLLQSQTNTQEVTKITEGIEINNINQLTSDFSEKNEDFVILRENIQGSKEDYSASEIRKMLSEEISDKKVVSAIMKELDKSIVFRGEESKKKDSGSDDE